MSEVKAAQAAKDGASIYADLMDFSLAEPRQQMLKFVERKATALTGDLAEELVEQLAKAYIAGVADGYRQALTERNGT